MKTQSFRVSSTVVSMSLILLSACSLPIVGTGLDGEDLTEEPYPVGLPEDEEWGTISVHIVDSLNYPTAINNCDALLTVWMPFYQHFPAMVSKGVADFDSDCDFWGVMGYSTTTTTMPVTFSLHAEFTPKPSCELKIQVDILYRFTEVQMVQNTILGDVPIVFEDDYFYPAPEHVFQLPGETQSIVEGMYTLSITPDDYSIPEWTGCRYE